MTLLIHSMSEFGELILQMIALADAKHIAEIGAEYGGMSSALAADLAVRGGTLTSIDPSPKPNFRDWVSGQPHVRHVDKPSLAAIHDLRDIDAWLIDGDHNWYTVYHELKQIDANCQRDGKPLFIFLHDVAWPCARRDLYYAPAHIPAQFIHPHDFDAGAVPGRGDLIPAQGFRGMGQFAFALHEGGPRNGVKTAIDDFVQEKLTSGVELAYAEIPAVFGLGVLFALDAPWSQAVAESVVPYHDNQLIASLERNRLANYLTVLAWQDRTQ
jgi:hypothetical protein